MIDAHPHMAAAAVAVSISAVLLAPATTCSSRQSSEGSHGVAPLFEIWNHVPFRHARGLQRMLLGRNASRSRGDMS